mmetsp:Transcript_68217/g.102881  ORF Transcript_68217/g.102881 Transcript_68217/m.102881 type:complete len:332 (+) Transcript_68217:2-997(+)
MLSSWRILGKCAGSWFCLVHTILSRNKPCQIINTHYFLVCFHNLVKNYYHFFVWSQTRHFAFFDRSKPIMTEPSDELDHLDKQAERGADSPQFLEVNKKVFSLLPELKPGSKILDFGCGPGRLAILMAQSPNVESVVGTDISEAMITRATKYAEDEEEAIRKKLTWRQTSRHPKAELEPIEGSMDLVVMSFVLGHIAPRQAGKEVFATAASTLKQGGQFALAEFAYSDDSNAGGGNEDQHHGGDSHNHNHQHHHSHHHHSHNHHHHHDDDCTGSGEEADRSHHGGHVAFIEEDVRRMFKESGLEPAEEFVAFEFEWHGKTIKSMMALGTKI